MSAKRGFIQFIPMIVLGIAAVSTFVILSMLGTNQDIRGRAAMPKVKCINGTYAPDGDISLCPPIAQKTPSPVPVKGGTDISTTKASPTPAVTSAPAPVTTAPKGTTELVSTAPKVTPATTPVVTKAPEISPAPVTTAPKGTTELVSTAPKVTPATTPVVTKAPETTLAPAKGGTDLSMTKVLTTPIPTTNPKPTPACSGSCITGPSDCYGVGKVPAAGSCQYPAICCTVVSTVVNNCTRGETYCVSATTVAACKADKSGYTTTPCTSETTCDVTQKRCIPKTTLPDCGAGLSCTGRFSCLSGETMCRQRSTGATLCCKNPPSTITPAPAYVPSGAICGGWTVTGDTCSKCQYGVISDLGIKHCAAAPSKTPTPHSKAIGDSCSTDTECASGHCMTDVQFAAAHTGAPPAWNATTTCITAKVAQELDALAKNVAISSAVAAAPIIVPSAVGVASSLPLMGVMAQNALPTIPGWVSPALTFAGTVPGLVSNTKCLTRPDLCTEADKMNIFMTGTGIQQFMDAQAIQSLAAQKVAAQAAASQATKETAYVLLGDPHSDLASVKAYLQEQGVIDALGKPTGKQVVVVGDYFGKTTTGMSATGGNETLDYVMSLPGVKIIGNNDLRCVAGICALRSGDQAALDAMLNKTISLHDIQQAANDPDLAGKLGQLNYISVLPGSNTIAQHVDTAELARFALTPNDLATLSKTNPDLAKAIANITSLDQTFQPLTVDDLSKISQAVTELNLDATRVVNNINTQANAITQAALAHPSDATAIQNLSTLQNAMDQELAFYKQNSSQMLSQYTGILSDNTTPIDTIVYGHSPVSRMEPIVNGGYSGLSTDLGSHVTLVNVDQNLSAGMRIPSELWSKPVQGVIQVPSDALYLPQTIVPNTLTIGQNGTFVTFPQ